MKTYLRMAALAVPVALVSAGALAQPLMQKNMSTQLAMRLVDAVNAECGAAGPLYTMSIAVVDRAGLPVVQVSGDTASPHNWTLVFRKAFTARTYRRPSIQWRDETTPDTLNFGQRALADVIPLAGGAPVFAGEEIIGAVGVSGAQGGQPADDACARAAVEAVAPYLQ
jgi:uncharacterized protein GlcG (DUF336 family)